MCVFYAGILWNSKQIMQWWWWWLPNETLIDYIWPYVFDSLTTKSTKSDENFQKNRIYLSISLSIYLSIYDENKFKIFKSTVHIIYIHTDSLYFKVREIEIPNRQPKWKTKQWNNNDKK